MADDFRSFDLAMKGFTNEVVPGDVKNVRDAVALETVRGVVLMTPVDTGRARGNWQVSVGAPAEGYSNAGFEGESSGARAATAANAAISAGTGTIATAADPFSTIWLHNGVPYIRILNDGTLARHAHHMVERTVARIRRMFA